MPTYLFPYGHDRLSLTLSENLAADWIDPADSPAPDDSAFLIDKALQHPLGSIRIENFPQARTAVIAVNDKTRPVPNHILLPPLLHRLEQAGLKPENILILIATGTHTPMPSDEYEAVLTEQILNRYTVQSHDCDSDDALKFLGKTPAGTPVLANRYFMEADLKIVVGTIEPHHFAGFSGGYKTAAIGLTGRDTINKNHAMLLDPLAKIGEFERNPLRQDIDDIGRMMGVQFALNVVMNTRRQVISAAFGHPEMVMQEGIARCRTSALTHVGRYYDLVVASAGGYPKDINFYQAQKALTYAAEITKPGGTIILAAACEEGSGSSSYEQFMEGVDSYAGVFKKFEQQGFRVGPHKALQVALIGSQKRILIVSQMPPNWVYRFLMTPAPDLDSAFSLARRWLPPAPAIALLPHATNTIPIATISQL